MLVSLPFHSSTNTSVTLLLKLLPRSTSAVVPVYIFMLLLLWIATSLWEFMKEVEGCLVIMLGIAGELLLRVLDMSNRYKLGTTDICLMLKY